MIADFFPTGITTFLIGGILIGLATSFIYIMTGIYGGVSSTLSAALSYVSNLSYFQSFKTTRFRKVLLALSIVAGSAIYVLTTSAPAVTTPYWRLFVGGILVGIGVRLGRGCTSGHGICGISSFNLHSMKAVLVFMVVAIVTALLVGGLA